MSDHLIPEPLPVEIECLRCGVRLKKNGKCPNDWSHEQFDAKNKSLPVVEPALEWTAEKLALLFHDTYEFLAPQFGYETREDTKAFDPKSKNGRLMIAVCGYVMDQALSSLREKEKAFEVVNDVTRSTMLNMGKTIESLRSRLAIQTKALKEIERLGGGDTDSPYLSRRNMTNRAHAALAQSEGKTDS